MIGDGRQRGRGAAAVAAKDAAVERRRTLGGQGVDGERAAVEEGAPPHVDARGRTRPVTRGKTRPLTQGRPRLLAPGRTRPVTQQVGPLTEDGTQPSPMAEGGPRPIIRGGTQLVGRVRIP